MYKVALVDDEKWALADIVHTFPFEELGFAIVGQFTNAKEALREIPPLQPNLLIADIRMPSMSGLELIQRLRVALPALTAVLLSGYAEFAFAQSALKLDVFEYCLKPLDEMEASELLRRVKAHLNAKESPERDAEQNSFSGGKGQFSQLIEYVNEHIYEKLVLEELAKCFFLNANYCGQLFKSVTGKTFSQYIRDIRLARACELLSRTDMPIAQVAGQVGYEDLRYFSRVFADAMGASPRQYRNRRNAR